jgi:hypothetical protein
MTRPTLPQHATPCTFDTLTRGFVRLIDNVTPTIDRCMAALATLEAALVAEVKRSAQRASAAGEIWKLRRIALHRRTKKQVARLLREEARTHKRALGTHHRFALENA